MQYTHVPQVIRNGISAQYGGVQYEHERDADPTTGEKTGRVAVYFNLTVYDDGEVQIRDSKDSIIMDHDAFEALLDLHLEADAKFNLTPEGYERFKQYKAKLKAQKKETIYGIPVAPQPKS